MMIEMGYLTNKKLCAYWVVEDNIQLYTSILVSSNILINMISKLNVKYFSASGSRFRAINVLLRNLCWYKQTTVLHHLI